MTDSNAKTPAKKASAKKSPAAKKTTPSKKTADKTTAKKATSTAKKASSASAKKASSAAKTAGRGTSSAASKSQVKETANNRKVEVALSPPEAMAMVKDAASNSNAAAAMPTKTQKDAARRDAAKVREDIQAEAKEKLAKLETEAKAADPAPRAQASIVGGVMAAPLSLATKALSAGGSTALFVVDRATKPARKLLFR